MENQEYIVLRTERLLVPDSADMGGPVLESLGAGPTAAAENVTVSTETLSKAQRDDLRRDPRTRAMAAPMPLKLIEPTEEPDLDPDAAAANTTWGVEEVGATASQFDGSGIKVAVLDTGIDPDHVAFTGVNLTRKNFTTESDDDLHGHGTHCAGTIFGRDVDGLRIGVATGVSEAVIGKVLGEGGGSSAQLVEAIQWAVSEGSNVISMSLGIDFPGFVNRLIEEFGLENEPATSIALEQYRANVNLFSRLADLLVSQNSVQHGSLIVAASGNESNRPQYEIAVAPPAAGTGIVSVGALANGDRNGHTVANFSNTQCNLSGPGVNVISARLGGGLRSLNGTSMATPHVAGVAALWAQKQVSDNGSILSHVLLGQLLANASRDKLAAGLEREDVGEGIVQSP